MADINASTPVVAPATGSVTYDKWFLTQLQARITPEKAPIVVHLNRATNSDGTWKLMPRGEGAEIVFSLDAWAEMATTPEVAAAIESVTAAIVAYAQKKQLL